eukprot:CAMPEP_0169085724 /NCGR_PEP_ID=MMETSP1015-20121227/13317_1 /TAXON_ID=342587 /ORGANISM="Karlodinium micrum, Strain CCMP2283" /LENGTH=464 /DNA_ID=CAMNT_0009145839 /DNA_START=40 /DNA_END=1431 /DNA_ORIENTATION=+
MVFLQASVFIVAALTPLISSSMRLKTNISATGIFDTYCEDYAATNPSHATCVGCTTIRLPDGGKCQWTSEAIGGKRCRNVNFGWVYDDYVAEPQNCPQSPRNTAWSRAAWKEADDWKLRGGGQLHFIWWGNGGDDWLSAASASPNVLADAVDDPSRVHYWYDPSYEQLEKVLTAEGSYTLHELNSVTVGELAFAAGLDKDDVWNLVKNLKAKKGNGLACAKNFLSWLVLHSFGGQFFDTTVQILKPSVSAPPSAAEKEAFKQALDEPVSHVTFPFSQLGRRYSNGRHTVFGTNQPWADHSLNTFPVFANEEVDYTMLGNPELHLKVQSQPSTQAMPQPDVMLPTVDVWAIKAPRQDEALRSVVTEFVARASHYGLVDGREATIDFPIKLFDRDWDVGILMEEENKDDFQSALTLKRKTTIGNYFDARAVCLKSLSMMSLHAGLAKASGLSGRCIECHEIMRKIW